MTVVVSCTHFPACSGCSLVGVAYAEQLDQKLRVVRGLFGQAGLRGFDDRTFGGITPSPTPSGYRNRVKLVPAKRTSGDSAIRLGLYLEGSHKVVDIPGCPVQLEGINNAIEVVRSAISRSSIALYDEETHTGDLRFITVRQGLGTGEILVGFVTRSAECAGLAALAKHVMTECEDVVGVVQNINPEKGNVIFGRESRALAGREYFEEVVWGLRLRLGLTSFFQVNTPVAAKAYEAIIGHLALTEHDTLLDLYCGVGAIGLAAARYVGRVIGIEEVREAAGFAKAASRTNRIANAEFRIGLVEERLPSAVGELHDHGVMGGRLRVVVNPPRKGVDSQVVDLLARSMPARIAYLSCSPVTLIRDLGRLVKGGYRVRHVELFDMFPQTEQVETLAILEASPDRSDRPLRLRRGRR